MSDGVVEVIQFIHCEYLANVTSLMASLANQFYLS